MPKLEIEHLIQRIQNRIKQLKNDKLLEARDINVLLNAKQLKELKSSWSKQQALRKIYKTPITEQDKKRIGWKTIREVRLDILNKALEEAYSNLPKSFDKKLYNKNIQQAKIYLKTYFNEIEKKTDKTQAAIRANNELTRHGLQRIDGMQRRKVGLSKRDKEVREMEDDLRERFKLEDKKKW